LQTERAAAGKNNRIHFIDEIRGLQQIGLARSGRRSPHINTRNRALLAKNHRATGGPARVGEVANLDSRNVGDESLRLWGPWKSPQALIENPYGSHSEKDAAIHAVIIITKAARIPIGADCVNAVIATELMIATIARIGVGRCE